MDRFYSQSYPNLACGHPGDSLSMHNGFCGLCWCSERPEGATRHVLAPQHRVVLAAARVMREALPPTHLWTEAMRKAIQEYDDLAGRPPSNDSLLFALNRALPYLAHLRESYEDGAPELEDWTIVAGAIAALTGSKP